MTRLQLFLRRTLSRYLPNESQHLFVLTLVVGVVCGLVAVAFHLAIQASEALLINRATHASGRSWIAWTILSPTLAGLVAGIALTKFFPGARGSGIPQVKQAYAIGGGRIRLRDAVAKFVLSALQIGSGASLGREGPTVQICAGTASALARATGLAARNWRRMMPVGVAAAIAAAFNAPIAAVTFTIEEIVGALDNTVLSGVVVAAALAAVIERSVLGVHPVIAVDQNYGLDHPSSLALYAVLGVAAAVVSVVFTEGLLRLRAVFRELKRLPQWAHPAIGGLVTGVLAVLVLGFADTTGVTGGGYETLGHALAGQLGIKILIMLCVIKVIATVFSYSSGSAGGIFAPSLFIGAMLGGTIGYADVWIFAHEPSRQLGAFALVGMGAVFAGVVRAPITSVLIIFEMTGSYGLVLPLMVANMISYGIARRWRPLPIYEALIAQDGIVLPHGTNSSAIGAAAIEPTPATSLAVPDGDGDSTTARDLLITASIVPGQTALALLFDRLGEEREQAILVATAAPDRYNVVLSDHLDELRRDPSLSTLLIAADVARPLPDATENAPLAELVRTLGHGSIDALLVRATDTHQPIGVVTRAAVAAAVLLRYEAQLVQ